MNANVPTQQAPPAPANAAADLRVRIAWAERSRCEPWWTIGRYGPGTTPWFDKFTLWYIWAGSGVLKVGSIVHTLRPGTCAWLRPRGYYPGDQTPNDCLGVTSIVFDLLDAAGQPVRDLPWLPPEIQEVPGLPYLEGNLARIAELFQEWCSQGEDVVTEAERTASHLLMAALLDIARCGRQPPMPLDDPGLRRRSQEMLRLAEYMRANAPNLPAVSELARRAGYSVDYFSRLFQFHIGVSPQEFAIATRIDLARRLLSTSDMSVKEIAFVAGYHDPAHFSHQFRQRIGMSATEFRERIKRAKEHPR